MVVKHFLVELSLRTPLVFVFAIFKNTFGLFFPPSCCHLPHPHRIPCLLWILRWPTLVLFLAGSHWHFVPPGSTLLEMKLKQKRLGWGFLFLPEPSLSGADTWHHWRHLLGNFASFTTSLIQHWRLKVKPYLPRGASRLAEGYDCQRNKCLAFSKMARFPIACWILEGPLKSSG